MTPSMAISSYSSPGMLWRVAIATRNPSPIGNRLMTMTAAWVAPAPVSHGGVGAPTAPSSRFTGP